MEFHRAHPIRQVMDVPWFVVPGFVDKSESEWPVRIAPHGNSSISGVDSNLLDCANNNNKHADREEQVQGFRRRIYPDTMARRPQDRGPSNPAASRFYKHANKHATSSPRSSSTSTNDPSITPSSQSVVVDDNPKSQEAVGGYPAARSSVLNDDTASYMPTSPDIPPPSTASDTEIVGLLSSLSICGMQRVVIEVDDPETFQALCAQVDSWNLKLLGINAEPLQVHPVLSPRTQTVPSI